MKNKKVIISLVGVLIMLLLVISATYAYFSVTITGNGSKTMITANTPKKHSLSVSTLYDDIHIHVDNSDMKLANVGSYYGAVNDNRYEKDLSAGTHQIIEVSSKGMENIRYSCSGDIKVILNIDNGSMGSVLEKEDVLLYLKGLGLDETLDLSTLKMNNTQIYKTTFEIDGDSSDYLSAIVELINKESYQNYIANKMLNVSIEAENMVCHENGTYKYLVKLNKSVKEIQNGNEIGKWVSLFYDEEGIYQKIQNIYLVDYINTSKAIKTWELGDTDRGTKLDEVMGWLEETPNENDSYDLYIGAEGPMRAPKDMSRAFQDFTNLMKISGNTLDTSEVTNMSDLFHNDINLIDINALKSWNTSNVTNMGDCYACGIFYNCINLKDITPLTNWNTSKVIDMYGTFYLCKSLTDLTPLENWDVSNVTRMYSSFFNLNNLTNISALSNWDVSHVKYMGSMFSNTSINDITALANWNVSSVDDMSSMFNGTKISDLTALRDWDTSNVTDMSGIFNSTKINDLTPLSNWDVSRVENMSNMFNFCADLRDLTAIEDWKIFNVTNMSNMFRNIGISDLTPIKNWDISNVTNMSGMFGNTQISDLAALSNWTVSKVTDMSDMFSDCRNLEDISGLSKWDVSHVINMNGMFAYSPMDDLTPLKEWNVSSVTSMGYMFRRCRNLTKVDLSNWNVPKLETLFLMFAEDTNLTELELPKALYNNLNEKSNYEAMFGGIYTYSNGNTDTTASVSPNITVFTETSQVDWVKARLQEALGENNNSTVIAY